MRLFIVVIMIITWAAPVWAACDYSKIPVFAATYKNDLTTIQKGNFTAKDLDQKYPDGACQGWAPIIIAAAEGHSEMVKLLISKGVDVNATNAYGRTALMFASKYGFLEIVKELLKAKADPNIHSKTDSSAVIAAGEGGKGQVIRELLNHGAKVSTGECRNTYEKDACVRIAYVMSLLMDDVKQSERLLMPLCRDNNYDRKTFACDVQKGNDCLKRGGTKDSCMSIFEAALSKK